MTWTLIGLFLIPCGIVLYALMMIAKREDRCARHAEKRANPFTSVETTVTGFPQHRR